ncbi:MAG: acyltransferase family protein [Solirubrobacteraceae bacterium]
MPAIADRRAALPALTGLRMVAAFAVYISHIGPPHSSPSWLKAFFESGYMGVTLFFTLSGFVMTINYFDALAMPSYRSVRRFAAARFARLYPLYALMLIYMVLSAHSHGQSLTGWWQSALAIQTWSSNLSIAYSFDAPSWSIGVEVFLYACFPLIVLAMRRLRKPASITILAMIVLAIMFGLAAWFVASGRGSLPWTDPSSAHRWLYRTPLTRLGDFTLGILAARLYLFTRSARRLEEFSSYLAAGSALLIALLMAWPPDVFSAWCWDAAYAGPTAVLLFGLAAAPRARLARLLSVPLMLLLGEASFAFYMVHQPAIGLLGGYLWATATSATTVAFEVLTFGAILCLAVGLHLIVERPARVYLRRILGAGRQHLGTTASTAVELGGQAQLGHDVAPG